MCLLLSLHARSEIAALAAFRGALHWTGQIPLFPFHTEKGQFLGFLAIPLVERSWKSYSSCLGQFGVSGVHRAASTRGMKAGFA